MTTEIEKTRRQMYADMKRFEHMVGSTHLFKTLQDSLEAHLEELRKDSMETLGRLAAMTEERDQIQQRLHAIDHAYLGSQTALGVAGDCIRDTQAVNREYQGLIKERDDQIVSLKQSLENNRGRVADLLGQNKLAGEELVRVQGIARKHLDDCRSAEKLSDDLSEKLTNATTVIGQQEQLIVGQRLAIAELYMAKKQINIMAGGGRGIGSVQSGAAIVSNGAGYPGSGAGAVNHGVGAAGVRPEVGAGGYAPSGGVGSATGR